MSMRRYGWMALVVLLCLMAAPALADSFVLDGVTYEEADGFLNVIALPEGETLITIHGTVDGMQLNGIYLEAAALVKELKIAEGEIDLPYISLYSFTGLERFVLPSTLKWLPLNVLMPCPSLKEFVVHPDNQYFKTIDGALFSMEDALLAYPEAKGPVYDVPPGTKAIEWNAFQQNDTLTSVTIPEGVTDMSDQLFGSCTALERIEIPASVTAIARMALPYGDSMREIVVAEGNARYETRDGMLFDKTDDALLYYPMGRGTACDIPAGTKRIPRETFQFNAYIQSVTIPRSVTELEDGVFSACTALENVSLPITLERIGKRAFGECIALSRITLPPALRELDILTFNGCVSLQEISIPGSVAYIDQTAFDFANPDMVILAPEGSAGHALAKRQGRLWGAPDGTVTRLVAERPPVAVVNNASAEDTLALHAGPSEGSERVGQYPNGTTVEALGHDGAFTQVAIGPKSGYMLSERLTLTDPLTSVVALTSAMAMASGENGWVELRTYPSLDAPVIEPYDTFRMKVLDVQGVWYYVDAHELCGYLPIENARVGRVDTGDGKRYAVVINPNPRDRLNLRASPGGDMIGRYFSGTQVELLEESGEWFKVAVDGKTGYMKGEFLREIELGDPKYEWEYEDENPNG